jgi:hypothetical protein
VSIAELGLFYFGFEAMPGFREEESSATQRGLKKQRP